MIIVRKLLFYMAALWTVFFCGQKLSSAAEDSKISPPASMNERVISVPGDPQRPAKLVVTVLTPDGDGPFPLVVMNHGASSTQKREDQPRYRFGFSSYYFLSRGYAVALPMMRGFAGSEGQQTLDGCNQKAVGLDNAKDISAVVDFMTAQPYVDGQHVVVAGQSFGGWNTLALGTLHHPKVKGLVNFAGGANISSCRWTSWTLAQATEYYGANTTTRSIWFYGDNDAVFSQSTWHDMFERYTRAGGPAELVAYGKFMDDSHNLLGFPEGLKIWAPKVDAFLKQVGLPSEVTHPEYLPKDFPTASNFAAIDDVNAVPYLTDESRKTYQKFLSDPMPRVFVFSVKGLAASFNGGFDPLGRAIKACEERSQKCQVYAVDGYVAWVRPTQAPASTNFAPLKEAAAVPYMNDAARQAYERYLTWRKPKAFVVAPDGAWAGSSLGEDPLAVAMANCSKSHQGCKFYAVDDQVVWTKETTSSPNQSQ
ncbi:MAG: CocE/NonD family hydrolase [Rhodoferax sp.]|uniref:alpha/beta hydrolase family protein n=1 Tax=Rhodoferax sp. TaxID=50421 RepID=UPI00326441CF